MTRQCSCSGVIAEIRVAATRRAATYCEIRRAPQYFLSHRHSLTNRLVSSL